MASQDAGSRERELGRAQISSLSWIEPAIVVGSMIAALVVNRRRNYSILKPSTTSTAPRIRSPEGASRSSEDTLVDPENWEDASDSDDAVLLQPMQHLPKRTTSANRSAHADPPGQYIHNIHSRLLQKFPFLIEMFYWSLNYLAYQISKVGAGELYGIKGNANVELAQEHAISILNFEHKSFFSFLFFIKEVDVQRFFLQNHVGIMTVLNQIYSLVHIPGTVAFICWYYYAAPNFHQFSIARRTMALGNIVSFSVFTVWPCMPPRLLPESFGFEDTVRQAHAESVWVGENGSNARFNQLAAMPSLHFTYALIIGSTFIWHSGFLQSLRGRKRERNVFSMLAFMLAGVLYPAVVLLVIVATANHYYLDAVVAILNTLVCFLCNRVWFVLLPVERLLGRILHVDKPVPTTGDRRRAKRHSRWRRSDDSATFA